MLLYDSKKTTKIQEKYQSNKGELLAFIHFCQKHRFLLYPREFVLVTDHIALKAVKTMAFPRSLSLRWLDVVSNFYFTVEFRKGRDIPDVDYLSRVNLPEEEGNTENKDENEIDEEETNPLIIHEITGAANVSNHELVSEESFKAEQNQDQTIQDVKNWITSGTTPEISDLSPMPISYRQYLGILPVLAIENGLLVRKKQDQEHLEMMETRPCIPESLQDKIIKQIHEETGHKKLHPTFHLLLMRYWLPAPTRAILRVIATCEICQRKDQSVSSKLRSQKRMIYSTRCSQPM